ncbi:MAG: MBL fold metallo-hydrolase [Anaerolineales bacterium]|nr:MBL fold metallo-hydrolase [Anaerolineales bacterium]
MLNIKTLTLGPVQTNCYLLSDSLSKSAVVVDPAWHGLSIIEAAKQENLSIEAIWLTHAHFDHLGGVAEICVQLSAQPKILLHKDDFPLWQAQGGAPFFGMHVDTGPQPDTWVSHGQKIHLGEYEFEVRHAPGHTPGHVIFYCATESIVFCGDVIFQGSIGRTDLPGGDYQTLMESIKTQIMVLPDETRLLSGHGPETTVGEERQFNPFLF